MNEQAQQDIGTDGPDTARSGSRPARRVQTPAAPKRADQRPDDVAGSERDADPLGDREPIERADRVRAADGAETVSRQDELADDTEDATAALRRNAEKVRQTGEGLKEVHERLQSTADRVQALRDTARSLSVDIDRTREAVEQPLKPDEG